MHLQRRENFAVLDLLASIVAPALLNLRPCLVD